MMHEGILYRGVFASGCGRHKALYNCMPLFASDVDPLQQDSHVADSRPTPENTLGAACSPEGVIHVEHDDHDQPPETLSRHRR